jgi:inner membrane protein
LAFGALALSPDLDVIAFRLGIPYAAEWGHRGATHSLVFAALVSLGLPLLFPKCNRVRMGLLCFLAIGSHGLLDALTDGGLGAALLWPFSNQRYFAPWTPLPVAPIGKGMLSHRGVSILLHEAVVFLPLWAYALWPRRTKPLEGS